MHENILMYDVYMIGIPLIANEAKHDVSAFLFSACLIVSYILLTYACSSENIGIPFELQVACS